MSFKILLSALMERVPGLLGVILADWEGEAIDQVARMDDYELKVTGAHKGVILSNLRQVIQHLAEDALQEIVITTEKVHTLVLPITDDYFLVLLLERSFPVGQALFEARQSLQGLRQEIG